jgi:integrase
MASGSGGRSPARPSKKSEQAKALLAVTEGSRWHAYVALSLLAGIRTEEARALRWDHVVTWADDAAGWQPDTTAGFDHAREGEELFAIYVWRSQRHGGDTKTGKSRRTLALPRRCVEALREHRKLQVKDRLRAGALWQDRGLVLSSTVGTPLSANNVIRSFRTITEKAGLGRDWVPREMRHTFVSVLSANGVPVENIALLAGHDRTTTTELVYRHEIRPALTRGAEVMDRIFG